MSWVFKADNGKYLHSYRVGLYGRIEQPKWTEFQMWAHRFTDRNVVSEVSSEIGEPGVIVTLLPSGMRKAVKELGTRCSANEKLFAAVWNQRAVPLAGTDKEGT